jgi:hypothetical protein
MNLVLVTSLSKSLKKNIVLISSMRLSAWQTPHKETAKTHRICDSQIKFDCVKSASLHCVTACWCCGKVVTCCWLSQWVSCSLPLVRCSLPWVRCCLSLWNDVLRIFKELSTLLRSTHLKVVQLEKEILKLFRLNSPIRLDHINSWVAIKHTNRNGTPPQETGGWNWRTRGTGTSYLKGLGRIVDFQVQEISAILVVRPWCLVICVAQS